MDRWHPTIAAVIISNISATEISRKKLIFLSGASLRSCAPDYHNHVTSML